MATSASAVDQRQRLPHRYSQLPAARTWQADATTAQIRSRSRSGTSSTRCASWPDFARVRSLLTTRLRTGTRQTPATQ